MESEHRSIHLQILKYAPGIHFPASFDLIIFWLQ
jgi:hypothetical protein